MKTLSSFYNMYKTNNEKEGEKFFKHWTLKSLKGQRWTKKLTFGTSLKVKEKKMKQYGAVSLPIEIKAAIKKSMKY